MRKNNPSTLSSLVSLADVLTLQGRHAEAAPLLKRVVHAMRAKQPPGSQPSNAVLDIAERLAKAYRQARKEEAAKAVEARFKVDGGPAPAPKPAPAPAAEAPAAEAAAEAAEEEPPLSPEASTLAPSP